MTTAQTRDKITDTIEIRPWVRFWARHFDYLLLSIPLIIVLDLALPIWRATFFFQMLWVWPLLSFIWIFIETWTIEHFHTTPGKWMLRVHVAGADTYPSALKRGLSVWVKGMGCGIPFVSIIVQIISYFYLKQHKVTRWDEAAKTRTEHARIGRGRVALFVLFFIVLDVLGPAISGQFSRAFLFMDNVDLKW